MKMVLSEVVGKWMVQDGHGVSMVRQMDNIDITDVLWRAVRRGHIDDVQAVGVECDEDGEIVWEDGRAVEVRQPLFSYQKEKANDYARLRDVEFEITSRRDRLSVARILWAMSELSTDELNRAGVAPVPQNKRPTSRKATAANWEYTTPGAPAVA